MIALKPLNAYHPVKLGLVGAAVLFVSLALVVGVLNLHLGDRRMTVEFARVDGARAGDDVRISGVSVGKVTKVELVGDRIVMSFRISDDVHLGRRTSATIKLATLLGAQYLELTPGGTEPLPHDRIPLANTSVPFTLEDTVDQTEDALSKLDGEKLREAFAVLGQTFGDRGDLIGGALQGSADITNVVAQREDQITSLIVGTERVTSLLKNNRAKLVRLVGQSDSLLREMHARREAIHALLVETIKLTKQLSRIIGDDRRSITTALRNLQDVTAILTKADASIDRAMESLAPAARYLANATGTGPFVTGVLNPVADAYVCMVKAVDGCS